MRARGGLFAGGAWAWRAARVLSWLRVCGTLRPHTPPISPWSGTCGRGERTRSYPHRYPKECLCAPMPSGSAPACGPAGRRRPAAAHRAMRAALR